MQNPFLQDQAKAITNQVTGNLQRSILPGINQGAIASGGFGGSRMGIAQGLAIGETNQGLSNSLANLYGNAYAQDQQLQTQRDIASMNDATQRYGLGNQFTLGQGNLALGNKQADQSYNLGIGGLQNQLYGMDQNFYTNQRGQDIQQLGLGANLFQQGQQGLTNQGQQMWGLGQAQQQAPWQALQQYSGVLSPYTGYGQTQQQTQPGGSTFGNALGGALTFGQLLQLLGGGK